MRYTIFKQTYSERQAYRYQIADETEQVCYLAEPTGLFLPNPTRLITLFDATHNPIGRIEPPPPSPWRMGGTYTLFLEDQDAPLAEIEERWNLVDLILLRLPRYLIRLEGGAYIARGSRYGERLYEILLLRGEELEEEPSDEEERPDQEEAGLDEAEVREALASGEVQAPEKSVGEILRPDRGPHYIVETQAAPLCQAPLALIGLVVVADLHLHAPLL